ncbi:MAG: hypothetical protein BKP49_04435 [Treponema sp. CETP13]|nr:MAG: hypothetical protein BKP49_04435 [Treponema sp. CETP13]
MSEKKENVVNFKKGKKVKSHHNHTLFMTVGGIIIFVMATVAFIVAPALVGNAQGQDIPPLGEYNGHKIEYKQNSYFANMVSSIGTQYQSQGQTLNNQTYYQIFNQAFNSTVVYYEAQDQLENAKYVVPESEIGRGMLPYFQDQNGKFSNKIYSDTSDSDKIAIRNEVETSLSYQRYISDLFGTNLYDQESSKYGLKTSAAETDFISNMNNKQRSFTMASFNTADYPKTEAAKYGKENSDKFIKYNLLIVTLKTQEDAESIASQITNGTLSFEDAVSENSTKNFSDDKGKLTNNYAYQLDSLITSETADDDIASLKSLKVNATTGAIKTSQGYSVFKCEAEPEESDMSDSIVIDDVYTYMTSYERGEIEDYFINKAKDVAAEALSGTLANAAKKEGATMSEISAFPLNYGNNSLISPVPTDSVPELANAESNETFLETAFALSDGEISKPITLNDYIVVLQLDEEKTVESNKDQVAYMYPYYTSQFDQQSLSSYVMNSDKLENNLFSVYLQYFMNNN